MRVKRGVWLTSGLGSRKLCPKFVPKSANASHRRTLRGSFRPPRHGPVHHARTHLALRPRVSPCRYAWGGLGTRSTGCPMGARSRRASARLGAVGRVRPSATSPSAPPRPGCASSSTGPVAGRSPGSSAPVRRSGTLRPSGCATPSTSRHASPRSATTATCPGSSGSTSARRRSSRFDLRTSSAGRHLARGATSPTARCRSISSASTGSSSATVRVWKLPRNPVADVERPRLVRRAGN